MHITIAGEDDLPLVRRIMREAFAEYAGMLDPPSGSLSETLEDVRKAVAAGGAIVAWVGDNLVKVRIQEDNDANRHSNRD